MIDFTKLKGRRVYQFALDEETGEITDITSRDDYVRVVRCKDCRNYVIHEIKQNGDYDYRYRPSYCLYTDQHTKPTDFCSWAERKEEC